MIKNIVLAAALAAASVVATGCASDTAQASNDESIADREYPTGSSIPRKTSKSAASTGAGTDVYDRDALERAQQDRTQGVIPSAGARSGGSN